MNKMASAMSLTGMYPRLRTDQWPGRPWTGSGSGSRPTTAVAEAAPARRRGSPRDSPRGDRVAVAVHQARRGSLLAVVRVPNVVIIDLRLERKQGARPTELSRRVLQLRELEHVDGHAEVLRHLPGVVEPDGSRLLKVHKKAMGKVLRLPLEAVARSVLRRIQR